MFVWIGELCGVHCGRESLAEVAADFEAACGEPAEVAGRGGGEGGETGQEGAKGGKDLIAGVASRFLWSL